VDVLNPEAAEPPALAVGAISRELRRVAAVSPEAWLLTFLDLVDKARKAEPTPELAFIVHAALASAPLDDRQTGEDIAQDFEVGLRKRLKGGKPLRPADRGDVEVLVVCPKQIERRVCAAVFGSTGASAQLFDSHIRYHRFPLVGEQTDGRTMVTLVCMQEAGNVLAANVVRDYVGAFGRPDLAILCGMAMGTVTKVRVGDVVVASDVIDYEPQRLTVDEVRTRLRTLNVPSDVLHDLEEHADAGGSSTLDLFLAKLSSLEAAKVALPVAVRERRFEPRVHVGMILAGEKLVEDNSAEERARLHDRAYALEMEGAGFAATCRHIGCDWMVVRGVADRGGTGRTKTWQGAATAAAASFALAFLLESWRPSKARPAHGR